MQRLTAQLDCFAGNLALEEAMLESLDEGECGEFVRVWEWQAPVVVIGRSSRLAEEVNLDFCKQNGIEVYRRCSGGAAVVGGAGCLMYAVGLHLSERPALRKLEAAHQFVMERTLEAARCFDDTASIQGISDLAIGDPLRKCSGNSMRYKRDSFLYHGTLLYDFPLELIPACLAFAPRQPAYRDNRKHGEFVANLKVDGADLRDALLNAWQPSGEFATWPEERVAELTAERYDNPSWTEAR